MSLVDKYKPVIDLLDELNVEQKDIKEERGFLILNATVKNPREKQLVVDKIHEVNQMEATDIKPNIKIVGEE